MVRLHNLTAAFVFAATMLAGCGGSQPTIGNPEVMPQGRAITQQATYGKPWMLPEAKKDDLLYVADWGCGCLRVFSYPKGKPVGVVAAAPEVEGECTDQAGNVWVTSARTSQIIEFAHGEPLPIAHLYEDRNTGPRNCSVDPVTGDLAVTNSNETIAIFPHAQGTPTIYRALFNYCAYDADGNLFADWDGPEGLFELPRGGNSFSEIALSKTIVGESIQWDGQNLAIFSERVKGSKRLLVLYRVHVSGPTGTVVGRALLRGNPDDSLYTNQFWVQGSTIVGAGPTVNDQTGLLDFWKYPTGGQPKKSISVTEYPGIGPPGFTGVTVSLSSK